MTGLSKSVKTTATVMTVATGILTVAYLYGRVISDVCPNYEPLDSFDVAKFTGVWYELQRDESIRFQTGECVTA